MKRLITILFVGLCFSAFGAKAQNATANNGAMIKEILRTVVDGPAPQQDLVQVDYLDAIYNQLLLSTPRYKMYEISHEYCLLKLDTATGRVWMVQIGMGDKATRKEIAVDDSSPLGDMDTPFNGRFELYPTNNSYNFIMIDTFAGTTYQVQWHTESNKRFRKLIP